MKNNIYDKDYILYEFYDAKSISDKKSICKQIENCKKELDKILIDSWKNVIEKSFTDLQEKIKKAKINLYIAADMPEELVKIRISNRYSYFLWLKKVGSYEKNTITITLDPENMMWWLLGTVATVKGLLMETIEQFQRHIQEDQKVINFWLSKSESLMSTSDIQDIDGYYWDLREYINSSAIADIPKDRIHTFVALIKQCDTNWIGILKDGHNPYLLKREWYITTSSDSKYILTPKSIELLDSVYK